MLNEFIRKESEKEQITKTYDHARNRELQKQRTSSKNTHNELEWFVRARANILIREGEIITESDEHHKPMVVCGVWCYPPSSAKRATIALI